MNGGRRVYLDNHATTRVDPRVVEAMLPWFTERFGNAGSINHGFGDEAREQVDRTRESIASGIGASAREIVFTSGATESNNLAIKGICGHRRRRGDHVISARTEHRAVLDPLERLARRGFKITWLPVADGLSRDAGRIDPEEVASAIRDETCLVTIMLANNEIGVIQPIADIARHCQDAGVPIHTDATQAVGKIPVDVEALGVDLLSFSGHKIYGPKGVGGLYVRRQGSRLRLEPLIDGGGQEGGLRSGTLNVPGIVGLDAALQLCLENMDAENRRLSGLRNDLFQRLSQQLERVFLNGPVLEEPGWRLPGNLNCSFAGVDGEALMMNIPGLAVSSGSACTATDPEPSHVLRALGFDDDRVRASLRFGLGRFNTAADIDVAVETVVSAVRKLRSLN